MDWIEIKMWLEASLGLDRDALHIYAAVGIQIVAAFIIKRSLASLLPWILALSAALLNEYSDFQRAGPSPEAIALFTDASIHDIWNTMLLPTALLLLSRFMPQIMINSRNISTLETRKSNNLKNTSSQIDQDS